MRSIKPGRGPSMMGAFGSAAAAIFGVFWTYTALSMGAPIFFAGFGVVFVLFGIGQAIYNLKNATGKNRFSDYDITDSEEESDPLDEHFRRKESLEGKGKMEDSISVFCPYCGTKADEDFLYCKNCGKRLPA